MKIQLFLIPALVAPAFSVFGNQAVSEFNGKIDASYGSFDSFKGETVEGSFSVPVAEVFGFQFDGLYGDVEDVEFKGVGAHFFWRDFETGLVGLSAGVISGDLVDSFELGIEAEYYIDWLTLGAKGGYSSIEYDQPVPFIETDESGVFGLVYATVYPFEDLSLTFGVEQRFANTSVRCDVEYELPVDGLSILARTMVAEHDYDHVLFGLRYYFGGEKTLKQRHRHDDPRSVIQDVLFGMGAYGAEFNEKGENYSRTHSGNHGSNNYGSSVHIVVPSDFETVVVGPEDL